MKKLVDVTVSESDLGWLILRPSMLVDRAGTGTVSLGPAQPHDEIGNGGVPLADSLPLLAPTLAWVLVGAVLALRLFRWEPRQ